MFQIAIDTDTMPVSPAVYADEYMGRALPTVLPLVQGFRGNLRVYFLGEHAPSENAAVALYLRALQSKEKLVQTSLGTRGVSEAGNVYYDIPLAADTTALSAVLGNRENVIMRAGIVANDVTASPQTNFEWQLNIAVSASAIGTGEKPPVSPNAIEEHNNDVAAHPFILNKVAAAEVDILGLRSNVAVVSENLNATNTNLNNAKSELSSEISSVSASLSAEIIARENADAELRAALTEEQGARSEADSELRAAIDAEASERKSENSELRAAISEQTGDLRAAISDETTARSEAVSELGTKVSEEITVEATAREGADSELRLAIATEEGAREAADSELRNAIESEVSERKVVNGTFQNAIFGNTSMIQTETKVRSEADSELRAAISEEATVRSEADVNLGNLIASEVSARSEADANLNCELQTEVSERKALITKSVLPPFFCSTKILDPNGNKIICGNIGSGPYASSTSTAIYVGEKRGIVMNSSVTNIWGYSGNLAFSACRYVAKIYSPSLGIPALCANATTTVVKGGGTTALCANSTSTVVSGGGTLALSASIRRTCIRGGGADAFVATNGGTNIYGNGSLKLFADSGSELVISAGNAGTQIHGGRIDICGACVYVNGVKIST